MNNETVYLDIETTNPGDYETATTTPDPAPDGVSYYYKFSGGTDSQGNVDLTTQAKTQIDVSLKGSSHGKYDLDGASEKTNTSHGDIAVTNTTPNKITINDKAEVNRVEMTYTVNAKPKNTDNVVIHCDPRVRNDW
ncbi:MAG: hypothetical protein ABJN62_03215 [Halioglobus sp.]